MRGRDEKEVQRSEFASGDGARFFAEEYDARVAARAIALAVLARVLICRVAGAPRQSLTAPDTHLRSSPSHFG